MYSVSGLLAVCRSFHCIPGIHQNKILVPVYYILKNSLQNNGLWIAFMSFMLVRGILHFVLYKKTIVLDK